MDHSYSQTVACTMACNTKRSYGSARKTIRKNKDGVEWLLGKSKWINVNKLRNLVRNLEFVDLRDASMVIRHSSGLLKYLMKLVKVDEKRRERAVQVSDVLTLLNTIFPTVCQTLNIPSFVLSEIAEHFFLQISKVIDILAILSAHLARSKGIFSVLNVFTHY